MVRHTRVVSVLVVLGVALLAGRCASDRSLPTGITPDLSAQSTPSGLLQCSKLPSTSLKQTIGSAGGTMRIGPHVFVVPSGALVQPVTISAKTAGGTGNAVDFKPMPTATATQTVGPAGGVIRIGPHALSIPAGALDAPVTITATAPSDKVNRVQFQPEGLVFQRAATLTMSYANCNLLGTILP